jgi:glyoxylase I family protein
VDVEVAFTGLAISDMETARAFFERVFDRPADIVASPRELMWRLTQSAWLYIVMDAERAGRGLATLSVRDLDAALSELAWRDVTPDTVEAVEGAGRKATVLDPDGNSLSIIEVFS